MVINEIPAVPTTLTTFNLNDYIQIRPRLPESIARCQARPHVFRPMEDGWFAVQLWEFCFEFGAELYNGCEPPVETTIRLGR